VGGTRQRHFAGTNSKPQKLPENAATPTRRVHAVLGVFMLSKTHCLKKEATAKRMDYPVSRVKTIADVAIFIKLL